MTTRHALTVLTFACPRSCRWAEKTDVCRFTRILTRMGVTEEVNSHTRTVNVAYVDVIALQEAVAALGWQWLGCKEHTLFETREIGNGIQIPGWRYPVVVRADGKLALDDYHGQWGRAADLDRLAAEYRCRAALRGAAQLGWIAERNGDSVRVYHPAGGVLDVRADGVIDAVGFIGSGCHEAADQLTKFIGSTVESMNKPEALQQHQHQVQEEIG